MARLSRRAVLGALAAPAVLACGRGAAARAQTGALTDPLAGPLTGPLAGPEGTTLLTVTGAITTTNSPAGALLDLALLESLPQRTFVTRTIWTEGPHSFSGVLLHDLLARLGAKGREIVAVALNDYSARLPLTEVTPEAPLLAYRMDGKPMSVREKGPIWMVYPFDSSPAYRTEETYSRAVWQLVRLEIRR